MRLRISFAAFAETLVPFAGKALNRKERKETRKVRQGVNQNKAASTS
jgi:hypothetical protein